MNGGINPRLLHTEPLRRCNLNECKAACCLHGAWVDQSEVDDILANRQLFIPHLPPDATDPSLWFDDQQEADPYSLSGQVRHTNVLPAESHYGGTACIFLRPDYKCALQVAADNAGFASWRFKPFYCILHPLDLDDQGRITLDETRLLLNEPASCVRSAEEPRPLLETFEPELRYFLGNKNYQHWQKAK
jgi:hypothetical protein